MPSAHGGKRRILVSRKQKHKNRKSQQTRKKCHFKRGRRLKHNAISKHGKSSHKKPKDSSLNDSKTLQQLHRDSNMYMTTKAKGIMIAFVKNLYRWVSVEAERLRRERKRSSIGFGEPRTALKTVVPGKCNKCRGNSPKRGGPRHMKVS